MRPRLLDLFCGAGGAGWGYTLAGFEVIGVDICQQPNYPLSMIQADALEFLSWARLSTFDAIHASPPCQRYMTGGRTNRDRPDLIGPVREALKTTRLPWVIENVPESPLRRDVVLCGSMFGLGVRRHRWFEASVPLVGLLNPCHHGRPIVGVYGHPHGEAGAWPGMLPGTLETWREAMDIGWMTAAELAESIPPAYTEHIGGQLLEHLARVRERCERTS